MDKRTYDIVARELQIAVVTNGYKFTNYTADQVANDLIAFSTACFDMTNEEVTPCVVKWFKDEQGRDF